MYLTNHQLNSIIDLASREKQTYETLFTTCFPTGLTARAWLEHRHGPEASAYQQACQALTTFMEQLEFDALLDVEAMTICGRDLLAGQTRSLLPTDHFFSARQYVKHTFPSAARKEDAVTHLTDKIALSDYLSRAREALRM